MTKKAITTIFCDIGGVILTNGWGNGSRVKAAEKFKFDSKEYEERHRLIFGDYEQGKITLEEYLKYTLFFKERSFTMKAFIDFMYNESQPFPEMLQLIKDLKKQHHLTVVLLSNEGRELTEYRLKTFKLHEVADFFVISCFVGVKKPDQQIFRMAIDMANVPPSQIAYIDDRQLFVEIGSDLGMHGIQQVNVQTTRAALEKLL